MILLIHYEKKHGNVKINGKDFNSGDHDYSRLKELLDKNNILDYRVKSKNGWNFYAVFLYSDGTMRIGSGIDDGFNDYDNDTFEKHANNWKNMTKSDIENKGLPYKDNPFKIQIIPIRRHQYITDNIDPSFQVTLHEFLFQ